MAQRKTRRPKVEPIAPPRADRPVFVQCGKHYIDPTTVKRIRHVESKNLYIVDFKDEPADEIQYPMWLEPNEVTNLIQYLNVVEDAVK